MNPSRPIRKPGILFIGGLVGTIVGVTVAILVHDAMHYSDFRLNDSLVALPFVYFFAIGLRQLHDRHGWNLLAGLRAVVARRSPVRSAQTLAEHDAAAVEQNSPPAQFNRRRLQFVISGILTLVAVAYGVSIMVPAYGTFAEDFSERWAWNAARWDNEEVRRKASDMCMAGCNAQPRPSLFPNEDLEQCERGCSRPLWNPETAPLWWETPIAFLKSVWPSTLGYVMVTALFGPWLFGFLVVRVLPAWVTRFWRWVRTPDDVH
jgi:hypothetical protein